MVASSKSEGKKHLLLDLSSSPLFLGSMNLYSDGSSAAIFRLYDRITGSKSQYTIRSDTRTKSASTVLVKVNTCLKYSVVDIVYAMGKLSCCTGKLASAQTCIKQWSYLLEILIRQVHYDLRRQNPKLVIVAEALVERIFNIKYTLDFPNNMVRPFPPSPLSIVLLHQEKYFCCYSTQLSTRYPVDNLAPLLH